MEQYIQKRDEYLQAHGAQFSNYTFDQIMEGFKHHYIMYFSEDKNNNALRSDDQLLYFRSITVVTKSITVENHGYGRNDYFNFNIMIPENKISGLMRNKTAINLLK